MGHLGSIRFLASLFFVVICKIFKTQTYLSHAVDDFEDKHQNGNKIFRF